MFYEKLRELLIEETGWYLLPINQTFLFRPEFLLIYFKYDDAVKLSYSISFKVNTESKKVKSIVVTNRENPSELRKRIFPIEEIDNIEILVKKIVEIIPFNAKEHIPRYNF